VYGACRETNRRKFFILSDLWMNNSFPPLRFRDKPGNLLWTWSGWDSAQIATCVSILMIDVSASQKRRDGLRKPASRRFYQTGTETGGTPVLLIKDKESG
jgi:hypothetical protein